MSLESSSKQAEIGAHVAQHYFNRAVYGLIMVSTWLKRESAFSTSLARHFVRRHSSEPEHWETSPTSFVRLAS